MNVQAQQVFASVLLDVSPATPSGLRVPPRASAARRLAVHRNNMFSALLAALEAMFPVTRALVGRDFFRTMVQARVRMDPPTSPVLAAYGEGFAQFLARFEPARDVPYLPDVARIEQARVHAYHASDFEPVALAAFAALATAPERLAATRITLHPACVWLRSDHPARSIWQAHQALIDPSDVDLTHIALGQPEDTLVVRPHLDVQIYALSPGAIECLDALRDGATLADAARHALHDARALESLFTLIVRHGLAIALHSPSDL